MEQPKVEVTGEVSLPGTPDANSSRRISSRSIKRKRFDDEIVEFTTPPTQLKGSGPGRSRTQSQSQLAQLQYNTTSDAHNTNSSMVVSTPTTPLVQLQQVALAPPAVLPAPAPVAPAHQLLQVNANATVQEKKRIRSNKKNKRNRGPNQLTTKDLGRWKPLDDLALVIGVQQTNDLRMIHRGIKFSCKFTLNEIQTRWYSMLYEEPISRLAVAAMRNLHPEMVGSVQSKALYSAQEEELLGTIKSSENPTLETFQELLDNNPQKFYPARNSNALFMHWQQMKLYQLLPDQNVQTLTRDDYILTFSDAEDLLNDAELMEARDEGLEIELGLADRRCKREVRTLENEIPNWAVLVDSLTGVGQSPEFDSQTLAVLRGRLVRFLMRSKEITFGRSCVGFSVDIDLSLEGPAHKVSRKQGTIKLRGNGDFFICNEGKKPIYVDQNPVLQGNKARLHNNTRIEIFGLKFLFMVNPELINAVRQESAKIVTPVT